LDVAATQHLQGHQVASATPLIDFVKTDPSNQYRKNFFFPQNMLKINEIDILTESDRDHAFFPNLRPAIFCTPKWAGSPEPYRVYSCCSSGGFTLFFYQEDKTFQTIVIAPSGNPRENLPNLGQPFLD